MFGLFKSNSTKKLENRYQAILKDAMDAQRSGDIRLYSQLSEKAEAVLKEIEALDQGKLDQGKKETK